MNVLQRAQKLLDPKIFAQASGELVKIPCKLADVPRDQYILRMCIKAPGTGYLIPSELNWLKEVILATDVLQQQMVDQPYCYITVRSGLVKSITDDMWHVDGFSMRIPHVPEQNYIWTDTHPTEVLDQTFVIPDDFDPLKHNIHQFFQDRVDPSKIQQLEAETLVLMDPYVVHRRPNDLPEGLQRTFFRISHVPIEIKDDGATPNPLLPTPVYNIHNQTDFRTALTSY